MKRIKEIYEVNPAFIREKCMAVVNTPNELAAKLPISIHSLGRHVRDKDFFLKRRGSGNYMFILVNEGKLKLNYLGEDFYLSKSDITFINCNDYQELSIGDSDFVDYFFIYMKGSSLKDFYNILYGDYFHIYKTDNLDKYKKTVYQLMHHCEQSNNIECYKILSDIFTDLMLDFENKNLTVKPSYPWLQECVEFINKNCHKKIDIDDLCEISHLSKPQLNRVFKKICGVSPYQYILEIRLEKSQKILKDTNYTLDYIAKSTGFPSASQFSQKFKLAYGVTPSAYRKVNSIK